jgi:hypothetical protein
VNVVPVADQSQSEQKKGDQQQARRLRRVDGVPVVFVRGVVVVVRLGHEDIVALDGAWGEVLSLRSQAAGS